MAQAPTTVWNEVRFTSEGISISLFSESPDGGMILEDEMWYTYDELQEMVPSEPLSMRLSDQSRRALVDSLESVDSQEPVTMKESVDSRESDLPEVGQMMTDTNAPSWSVDDRVEVVSISDKSADEYVVQESDFGRPKTVADVNYESDADETVIEAQYLDESGLPAGKVYGFPVSRLVETDSDTISQKEWHDKYGN